MNGCLGTDSPTRVFSLNDELFPIREKTSHAIPNWIRLDESLYFITISCREREINQLCMPDISKGIFSALEFYAQTQMLFPKLVLLMPDHLHGVFSFPARGGVKKPISTLKKYLARNYPIRFQNGFFEHRIRNEEHLRQIEDYILNNPVRKGLIDLPEQWEYRWYLKEDICSGE